MFAHFEKVAELEEKDDGNLSPFCEVVQNLVRKKKLVFLFEETDSSFLVSSKSGGVGKLYDLSKDIHNIANDYGFRMKIVIHHGDYVSGVSPTALGIVSYFGKPMNEACRMYDMGEVGQTSLSTQFYMQLCASVTRKEAEKIISESLLNEFKAPETMKAKGAVNLMDMNGKILKDGEIQRFIVLADTDAKSRRSSLSSSGVSSPPGLYRANSVHVDAQGKLSEVESAKALENVPIIYRKFAELSKRKRKRTFGKRTKSAENQRDRRWKRNRTASE